jgi:hypothetical protein
VFLSKDNLCYCLAAQQLKGGNKKKHTTAAAAADEKKKKMKKLNAQTLDAGCHHQSHQPECRLAPLPRGFPLPQVVAAQVGNL